MFKYANLGTAAGIEDAVFGYVAKRVGSVLTQTYKLWDYVVVKNCGTDGSAEIAHRFAAAYSRIRVQDNATSLSRTSARIAF